MQDEAREKRMENSIFQENDELQKFLRDSHIQTPQEVNPLESGPKSPAEIDPELKVSLTNIDGNIISIDTPDNRF